MKNLLIIYPHWVPSNLAGVHRPRLIGNFLHEFDWHPILLTVSSEYYEEAPDLDIAKTASPSIEVIYAKAYRAAKPRLIGDIGLRAFPFLYMKALQIIAQRNIDFIWIPIPSFYTSMLGRLLHSKTNIPYGIDYIDPWVRDISNRQNWRSKMSLLVAKWLEPITVKKASLISGVAMAYYTPVLERNFKKKSVIHVGMPYGFDPHDHEIKLDNIVYPWASQQEVQPLVYAGAFLPNSHIFVKALFKAIKALKAENNWPDVRKLYFLGTGSYTGTSISDYARFFGVEDVVYEIRDRFPYLHVLNYLSAASAVMVIGSTEIHYTASKTYQALLSNRPVLAIFHTDSSAVKVLKEASADSLLIRYQDVNTEDDLMMKIKEKLFMLQSDNLNWKPDLQKLYKYSARASAKALADKLNELV